MHDLIIIGAGPAGLAAAIQAAEQGLKTAVIDEYIKPGGRLLGQLNEQPDGEWWNGPEEADKLFRDAGRHHVAFHLETSVFQINRQDNGWLVRTSKGNFRALALLVAAGAAEKSIPVPGWTIPGVMTIGAAQVMANVHRVKPGQKGIIVGVSILSLAIARELRMAGVQIAAIVLPAHQLLSRNSGDPKQVFHQLLHLSQLAPSPLLKWGGAIVKRFPFLEKAAVRFYPKKGFKVWGIPIQLRRSLLGIVGTDKVEAVRVADVSPSGNPRNGRVQTIDADFVCLSGGLYPLVELLAILDCPFKYIPSLGGHVPVHNERMQTPLPFLYVAGNITGIESSKVAIAQGEVAGLSAAADLKGKPLDQRINEAILQVDAIRGRAAIQFHPDVAAGREEMRLAASKAACGIRAVSHTI